MNGPSRHPRPNPSFVDNKAGNDEDRLPFALALAAKLLLAVAGGAAGLTVGYLTAIATGLATLNC